MTRPAVLTCLLAIALPTAGQAQQTSVQNLLFVKKGKPVSFGKNDYQPGKNAFYLYRNCIYDLLLVNGKRVSARIIDIQHDSIYYTRHQEAPGNQPPDTLRLHPSSLKKLQVVGDHMLGLYKSYSFRRYRYRFEQADTARAFPRQTRTVYTADSSRSTTYELVPLLAINGAELVYEESGRSYVYEGLITLPPVGDTTRHAEDTVTIHKKWAWVTPTNANRISGLTLGIQMMQLKERPLLVEGVNIDAGMLSFFVSIFALFTIPQSNILANMPDTLDRNLISIRVNGLSISAGGLAGDMAVHGLSLNGGILSTISMDGLAITGTQNVIHDFKGVTIGGLRNMSQKGRGLQVGLLNICKDFRGLQIGLWNVNGRRKLPLINWGGKNREGDLR